MKHVIFPLALLLISSATAALAAPTRPVCPASVQFEDRKLALMDELRETRNAGTGLFLTQKLVSIWTTAPNWHAQELLNTGIMGRQLADYDVADEALTKLIAYCPTFAEAYHQRALVYRAREDYDAALADLDTALRYAPDHFGAMARKAQVLSAMGRHADARVMRADVLAINPWMPARLIEHEAPGTEI